MNRNVVLLCIALSSLFIALPVFNDCCAIAQEYTPDTDTRCSIEIELLSDQCDFPDEIEISVYKIAELEFCEKRPVMRYLKAYRQLQVPTVSTDDESTITELTYYIKRNNIPQDYTALANNGSVKISDLSYGTYLITKPADSQSNIDFSPFVVNLPTFSTTENEYIYDIRSRPKITVTYVKSGTFAATADRLPQTGQLWWPVMVLFLFGIIFITAACIMRILL